MRFVPAWVARSLYLAYTDGYAVGPPSFRHRPGYPLYHNLEPGTGVAAPHSPRLRVFTFIGLEFVFLAFLGYEMVVFHTAMILLALGLALVNLVVIWVAYLSWASNVLVGTPDAIYRYSGIYASNPQSFQGADIEEVSVSYRRPEKLWKLLGYGRVSVSFGKDKHTVWEIRGIGNAEGLGSLIRGLQRAEQEATTAVPDLLEEIRDLVIEIRGMGQAVLDLFDLMATAQPAPTPTPTPTGPNTATAPRAPSDGWLPAHPDTTLSRPPTIAYGSNQELTTYVDSLPTRDQDEPPDLGEPPDRGEPPYQGDPFNQDEPDPPPPDEGPGAALFDRRFSHAPHGGNR